jgi:hypothetical protein
VGGTRVRLEPAEARRLTVLLADRMAANRAARTPITAEDYRILDKLRPACRWGEADPIARDVAFAALKAAWV